MIEYIPFEFPVDEKTGFTKALTDADILRHRREELHLTQQQVADRANIKLRQYERFEMGERSLSGASMRVGLSVCCVLKLDPYEAVPDAVKKVTEEK